MKIFKDSLPAGLSYALKPSVLSDLLAREQICIPVALYQWRHTPSQDKAFFSADFYPLTYPYFKSEEGESITVTSLALPSKDRQAARQFIESEVLPGFVIWIKGIEALPLDSTIRREMQSFKRIWSPVE